MCDATARAPSGGAAGLEQDDGLELGREAQRLEEPPPVGDPFHVPGDDAGLRVVGHRGEHVGLRQVHLVAQAGEEREPEAAVARPVEDGGGERTGVRDEGDPAGQRHPRGEGHVEPARGPDPAEAVRAEDPQRLVPEPRGQLRLAGPSLRAGLAEAGADDDGRPDTFGGALLQGREDRGGGHGDDGEVDVAVHGQERGRRR